MVRRQPHSRSIPFFVDSQSRAKASSCPHTATRLIILHNMYVCTLSCGSLFAREFHSRPSRKWHIDENPCVFTVHVPASDPKLHSPLTIRTWIFLKWNVSSVDTSVGFAWNCQKVGTTLLVASGSWPSLTGRSQSLLKTGASWRSEPDRVAVVNRMLCDEHVRRETWSRSCVCCYL